ncbi:MAG: hypothetical protein A2Z20_11860 [Bdellovibrionales bacterium RBG_16_40_8]|nr:MAG: hypothetical protein A2Z20_11860 [Bdellovibrionales bacterium RBG_16_40_8]
MLSRYQKHGGFIQLVQLIETCGKQKQDKFIEIIEKEDPNWAVAIREKMLTIEKIMSWDNTILAEIAGRLQQLTIAIAMHGLNPESIERILSIFTHSQRRNIEDLYSSNKPNSGEISAAFLKILQETRSMISNGYLRAEKFAPELTIPEEYEDKLGKYIQSPSEIVRQPAEKSKEKSPGIAIVTATATASTNKSDTKEIDILRTQLLTMQKENQQLRSELRILREKMLQIRKIA